MGWFWCLACHEPKEAADSSGMVLVPCLPLAKALSWIFMSAELADLFLESVAFSPTQCLPVQTNLCGCQDWHWEALMPTQ